MNDNNINKINKFYIIFPIFVYFCTCLFMMWGAFFFFKNNLIDRGFIMICFAYILAIDCKLKFTEIKLYELENANKKEDNK